MATYLDDLAAACEALAAETAQQASSPTLPTAEDDARLDELHRGALDAFQTFQAAVAAGLETPDATQALELARRLVAMREANSQALRDFADAPGGPLFGATASAARNYLDSLRAAVALRHAGGLADQAYRDLLRERRELLARLHSGFGSERVPRLQRQRLLSALDRIEALEAELIKKHS